MTKHEAEATARAMEAAGYSATTPQQICGKWVVEGKRPNGVSVLISEKAGWEIEVNEQGITATPTPGARLKYDEPTQQVSITVPVSVLAAADAGGRGKRSAWFVQAARAWMEREGAG